MQQVEGWGPSRRGPRGLQGWEKCALGMCGRSPGPRGNSSYGVLEKMFCYLPQMTPPHVRETAAKEKSQILSFTQPLMWAQKTPWIAPGSLLGIDVPGMLACPVLRLEVAGFRVPSFAWSRVQCTVYHHRDYLPFPFPSQHLS